MKNLRHLKKKDTFAFSNPDPKTLDLFKNPGVKIVNLICTEVTSLCPITGQPDFHTVTITYWPGDLCIESKSLKLYLMGFRMHGTFTETMAERIMSDLQEALMCSVRVTIESASRGGIAIHATAQEVFDNDKI